MKIEADSFYGLNYIDKKEIKEVIKIMKNKSLFRFDAPKMCYETDKLEKKLSDYFNQNVLCVNNGTSALKMCLIANDIGINDEVLIPCLSFISTASSCLTVGALPIFVNIDDKFNFDFDDAEKKITNKTKAIILVHYQGQSCNMNKAKQFAEKHNLVLIEDVAQGFGARYDNKLLGTFGNCSAFSFQAGKTITSGEGGAFSSSNKKIFATAKRYADCGGDRPFDSYPNWNGKHTSFGENFKLTDLQSAILLKQFEKIKRIINHQEYLYDYIVSRLDDYNIRKISSKCQPFYMSLCFVFNSKEECNKFIYFTSNKNIKFSTKIDNFMPDYNTFKNKKSWHSSGFPYLPEYKVSDCSKSKELLERTAWLPLNSSFSKKEVNYIVKVLKEFKYE